MKSLRIAALSLLIVLWTIPVHASTIPATDPHIKQGGGDPPFPTGIIVPDFSILSPSGTSPTTSPCKLTELGMTFTSPSCFFENDINRTGTGETITKLVFDISNINPTTVSCQLLNMVDFAHCMVGRFDDGGTMVTFFGGPGIPFHGDFTLNFQGFPKNTSFGGMSTTAIPEPNTLALFLAGVSALLVGRRLRTRRLS